VPIIKTVESDIFEDVKLYYEPFDGTVWLGFILILILTPFLAMIVDNPAKRGEKVWTVETPTRL
jgi:hypothetical protein